VQPTPPTRQVYEPEPEGDSEDDDPDAELSEIDEELDDEDEEEVVNIAKETSKAVVQAPEDDKKRKRKRKDVGDEIEDVYMRKLEKEEAKDQEAAAKERASKRQKGEEALAEESDDDDNGGVDVQIEAESGDDMSDAEGDDEEEDDAVTTKKARKEPVPKHETQAASDDLTKATRTVFLGNVSTSAITSKSARRVFIAHLTSFFPEVQKKHPDVKFKLESIRFRSTPYAAALPKKAAYAKKELMDATTKSTNAYAVYSSPILSREAARRLNASKVLDRHLRVDEIAHPSIVDHKRCVFIGNLGFVDDETNIQAANAADGREVRKPGKQPADHEEGLWRTMSRHGAVESVRVIRDSITRVGKGIAYVQFADENSVEKALLDNEKKFPPMLPRKLRVSRAKAQKRNAKPGSGRPGSNAKAAAPSGYQRKITQEEAAQLGRQGRMVGKAGAAVLFKSQQKPAGPRDDNRPAHSLAGFKRPEAFVFEGHRATQKQGNTGLKLGGKGGGKYKKGPQKQGKPTDRSAKRGAAFKAGGSKKGKSAA
jgi:nucleolar protein 12